MAAGNDLLTAIPRRVLVTGAGGFIGRHVLAGRPASWELVALSRQEITPEPGLTVVRPPATGDDLPSALQATFDAIIHLAGNANHGLAIREPWADLIGTGVLAAEILGRLRARRLVVLSSAAVYAGLVGRVDPSVPVDPPMAYALSKRYVEGLAAALVERGAIGSRAVIRLYNAYGPGERPNRLIPRVVAAARAGDVFVLTGAPDSLADPIHVDDVARCLIAATEGADDVVLDCCGGGPTPLIEMVPRIAAALGLPSPEVTVSPDPDQVPIRFWSDPGPAFETFGIAGPDQFEAAVRSYGAAEGWLGAKIRPERDSVRP